MHPTLPHPSAPADRRARYRTLRDDLEAMLDEEDDPVSAMATIACELHHAFAAYDWTGFYRTVAPRMLAIGPYQGSHGCLRIPYDQGVCGAVARSGEPLCLADVHAFPGHIACASSTRSEVVVPVRGPSGDVIGVLDIDSDAPAAFDDVDVEGLTAIAGLLSRFDRI